MKFDEKADLDTSQIDDQRDRRDGFGADLADSPTRQPRSATIESRKSFRDASHPRPDPMVPPSSASPDSRSAIRRVT